MPHVRLILVGGFLGAGKTTLLARAAEACVRRGRRVGLITNDQAVDLVDTALLRASGLDVSEVAGGCFCCQFRRFVASAADLVEKMRPDVLLGEPVGSCTDLSATVLQPLKHMYGERFRLAPLSVLADPQRLREALAPDASPSLPDSVTYILRKQLEEADLVVINKVDLLAEGDLEALRALVAAALPGKPVLTISAATGEGVEAWLDRMDEPAPAGRFIADVDYDTYAQGEALLGWLNATVALAAPAPPDWADLCRRFLEDVRGRLAAAHAEIAHLKVYLKTAGGAVVGNLTSTAAAPSVRPDLAEADAEALLTVNARAHQGPEALREAVREALGVFSRAGLRTTVETEACLRPGRPTPAFRFSETV